MKFRDDDLRKADADFNRAKRGVLQEAEQAGWWGWDSPGEIKTSDLERRLLKNARKRDWVDVGNLAMMLWYRQKKRREA